MSYNSMVNPKAVKLLDELLSGKASEVREVAICNELDTLLPDPKWSEYIFWSDDYLNDNGSINYDKFFDKVFAYLNSEEYIRNELIIELANALINKDFTNMNEVEIVSELNRLSPDPNWTHYLFVDKSCLNKDGSVNKNKFLDRLFELQS
ncbi:hypothetical protein [Psychrobacter sp. FDAARGOS_221]|uniref:hypothetical protein n=1 Tax=Psychrobacter sp. FDAARGOS_221 TaxID=1975705 RepID=UPI000BB55B77|nr:hypothetical protein [Psychrobacter sp. FDAARGOS_221]PNK59612.1 hypothetical protein A6J60_001080 [Psychrobacter sp. FDAARGOS_221]